MATQMTPRGPRSTERPSRAPDGRRPWHVDNPAPLTTPACFFDLTQEDLEQVLRGLGKERFRAEQLFKWVYEKGVWDFAQMSNLSLAFREELTGLLNFSLPRVVSHLVSLDGTQKFLFDIGEGKTVEAVLIPSEGRLTLCISSEVGCNMACKFCFTGKQKLKKRLTAGQIVGQFIQAEKAIASSGQKISNIVFMGMGEPLDNPEAVFKSIEILHNPFGRAFSRRKVTVSTSGLIDEMWRIPASRTRLAVSLNGYDDLSRTEIMPINKRFPLRDLLDACIDYTRQTKDRVTFEYVLLKGVTDQVEHARALARLVRHVPCKINIIPFNEHPGADYQRPDDETIRRFHEELMRLNVHVLLRRTMGRDIYAACGQLTSEFENKPKSMDISNSRLGGLDHGRSSRRW